MTDQAAPGPGLDPSLSTPAWPPEGAGVPMPSGPPDPDLYRELLRAVIDPELGVNIVDLGLVYDVGVSDGVALVRMTLTTPGCPLGAYLDDAVRDCLWGAPGVSRVDVRIVWDPPWRPEMMSEQARAQLGWAR